MTKIGQCILCNQVIHFACEECNLADGHGTCKKCSSGYYVKNDICQSCPLNCYSCEEKGGQVNCHKCKPNYSSSGISTCDSCPNNCLECRVTENKLICLEGKCENGFTINSEKLCSKCPDNCKLCSYNKFKGETECLRRGSEHFCFENINGLSWTLDANGKCKGSNYNSCIHFSF